MILVVGDINADITAPLTAPPAEGEDCLSQGLSFQCGGVESAGHKAFFRNLCNRRDCHGLIHVYPPPKEERMAADTTMKEAFDHAGYAMAELPAS